MHNGKSIGIHTATDDKRPGNILNLSMNTDFKVFELKLNGKLAFEIPFDQLPDEDFYPAITLYAGGDAYRFIGDLNDLLVVE